MKAIVCVLLAMASCSVAASGDKQPAKRGVLGLGYGLGVPAYGHGLGVPAYGHGLGLGVPAYGHGLGLYSNSLYGHGWSGHGLYGSGLYGHGLGLHSPLVAPHAPLLGHGLAYPPLLGLGHGYLH